MTVATVFWLVWWAERHLGGALLETAGCAAARALAGAAGACATCPPSRTSKGVGAGADRARVYVALLAALERGRFVRGRGGSSSASRRPLGRARGK